MEICSNINCVKQGKAEEGIRLIYYLDETGMRCTPWFCSYQCIKEWIDSPSNFVWWVLEGRESKVVE